MNNLLSSTGVALLLSLAATTALAQKFTPGLWENSMVIKSGGAEMDASMAKMKEEMAKMPPDQRKMMEDMMARQGVSVGAGGKTVTVKACITPEMASRDELPQNDGNCKQTSKERSGNTVRIKFVCTGKEAGSGESEYTMLGDKQHKGRTVVNSVVNGKPQRMEMEHTGKWLGADCGDLKPSK